jgi:hypothetical protein
LLAANIGARDPQQPSDYFAAGGRSLWSIRDGSALRNESSVSIVFVNPAARMCGFPEPEMDPTPVEAFVYDFAGFS